MKTTTAVACLAFEVTLAGFIGSTDATDDRVLWVTAPSADELAAATEGLDCTVVQLDFVPQSDIDFELPRDRAALRTRIRQFMAGPERPDRDCDPGCTRRAVPTAECDCSRAEASSTDGWAEADDGFAAAIRHALLYVPENATHDRTREALQGWLANHERRAAPAAQCGCSRAMQTSTDLHAAEIQRRIEGFPEHALVPHSQEPWQGMLEPGEPNRSVILSQDRDGRWLMSIQHNGELTSAQQEADVRRIVASVNACTGIATSVLESIRGGFVDAAGEVKLFRLPAADQVAPARAEQVPS